ncbi:hypothetical protein [Mesorhizobium sp.]|uniref:hypothetical protein n=1 Tax=Mesorhizobium sp. TaxID=1871066 RepID=UPI0011FD6629|nr:hypothetical protein [Mesorhizobium sp.]TIO30414.1 MAG: hypothetical protein E5X89_27265 [Mesorhizobium sp.]
MAENLEIGYMRTGTAEKDGYVHEMLIHFDDPLHTLSERDMLMVSTPNGGSLNLQPVEMKGETLIVSAMVKPAMVLHFRLEPVDKHTRRLKLETHHIELQKLGFW